MTPASAAAPPDHAAKVVALEANAVALATSQRDLTRSVTSFTLFLDSSPITRSLETAQKHLASVSAGEGKSRKAAEWFLDNYYLIRRVARQVVEELPRGFVRHLPQLASEPGKGSLRIDAVARALVAATQLELDITGVRRFIDAYQQVSPLTIAEIWALPTLLRTCVLRLLLRFLAELDVPVSDDLDPSVPQASELGLEPNIGVQRAIHALRVLDAIDWKIFFEKTNRVEAILRTDPASVYERMDFETCDAYRKVVEALAWSTGKAEQDVATLAVALAGEHGRDERRGHVGHYLVDEGRLVLEARIALRARGLERLRRSLTARPMRWYALALGLFTGAPLLVLGWTLMLLAIHPVAIAGALLIATVPLSTAAVSIAQWLLALLLPPRTQPKLDFTNGLPDDARTLVVIPTLLSSPQDIESMVRQLELHYLCNPDPLLQFALLTDDVDAEAMPHDRALVDSVARRIDALNARHGKDGKGGPFHLLHREPLWNASEQRFMGWERKRGKLEELNRLLRGDTHTSYRRHAGADEGLQGIRFVITLDSDTQLPMGSARRLVGVLAHPLNHAVFDPDTGRVVAGYTIVQPRLEPSPSSVRNTRFARMFSGDIGFDIYTHAVSELYQDLFGAGIYVGKGIYDVDAFTRSVQGRVPDNTLVSHDLFEGVHGRTALATDIVLFEDYPSNYATYAKRMHRWMRGDWQLLPWLLPTVPSGAGRLRNRLARIDRWKILDNLRRSLLSPALCLLIILGWTCLPGDPLLWTLGSLALLFAPLLQSFVLDHRRRLATAGRGLFALVFLAFEASLAVDAIVRVVVRTAITHKYLLQWTTAAQTEHGVRASSQRAVFWRLMFASPLIAVMSGLLIVLLRPAALPIALPVLLSWCMAPEIARWVSQQLRPRVEALRPDERRRLRLLARKTWSFFDTFVGPNDQWLPIDNYQEPPHEQTAHRTSPTNIGLMLLSTMSAHDLGYIGPLELSLRLRRAFDSIARLLHYRGHLLNWYDTTNLQPLLPRYVSTVDSGNFAGCLVALKQGLKEIANGPVLRAASWDGLLDSLDLLAQVVESVHSSKDGTAHDVPALLTVIERMRREIVVGRERPEHAYPALRRLCDDAILALDRELLEFFAVGSKHYDVAVLHELRTSIEALHQLLQQMRRSLDTLMPWLSMVDEPAAREIEPPTQARLHEIAPLSEQLCGRLDQWESVHRHDGTLTADLRASADRVRDALRRASKAAAALRTELLALAAVADEEVRGMDFKLLLSSERKIFHIGYNATVDELDPHFYDLLASEARLASYIAIVKGDAPQSHWYALGRPMTSVDGAPALLSWGGTMFEYLMPGLLMRSQEGTMLAQTCRLAVAAQIANARDMQEPWGISESAYAHVDAQDTYQYRSFGVPGLGFRRGLEDDRVITPYASMLAVSIAPRAVFDNLGRLEAMGMMGAYGLYEALDFTAERTPAGRHFSVVRSYMAHHQGMLLVALGNELSERNMVDRFHSDAVIATGEILLNEHVPNRAPAEWPIVKAEEDVVSRPATDVPQAPGPWSPTPHAPQAFVLSNGRLTSLLTASGGGGLTWQGIALTRYQPDATRDDDGLWIYVRDEDSGKVWLASSPECRTTFEMHKAELHRRHEGISVHVNVAVAPVDDIEVRQIALHNESGRPRRLTVTTAGRPVLLDARQAPTHPAFSSMFVQSEYLADLNGLLFFRRPQSAEERAAVIVHRLVSERSSVAFAGYETDRSAFYGRCGSRGEPLALSASPGPLRGRAGLMLDPIMSLMAAVELKAEGSASLAFVTTVGRSRAAAVELARKYGSLHAVRWVFRDADQESPRRLLRAKLSPEAVSDAQRLFSALHFADPAMRAAPEVLAAGKPCQRRLWGHGISGDLPILLVRVSDAQAPLIGEVLAAQRYLRGCGVRFDLVLLDEQPSGYNDGSAGTLRGVLTEHDADSWIHQRGGVYMVAIDSVSAEQARDLEATAHVWLRTGQGSLAHQLTKASTIELELPRFEASLPDDSDEPMAPRPRPQLSFDNGIGGFSQDGREYVISLAPGQAPPAPWCNVIANAQLGCLVSESSLGVSWSLNSGENRLTPWRNDAVFDSPSEALYLRDEETAAVWTTTPLPAGRSSATLVRHGAGYTTYESESHGLEQALTVFVPPDDGVKVVRLRVRNTLARHRRLTATYYAEWVLGSRREPQRPFIVSELDAAHACLLASCSWHTEFGSRVAFLASTNSAHNFTTDRTEFLGRRGDYARPEALERWGMTGRLDPGIDPCAALQVHIELAPGQEVETCFLLGQADSRSAALALVERFRRPAEVDAAWTALHAFWDAVLGNIRVKTPEPAMDLMLNRWLLYQSLSARVFGRTGFYQSSGAIGYRDQLQDVLALIPAAPERTRAHLLEAARHQFEQGDVLHWWHPPSGRGVRTHCSDDLVWLPFVTAEYALATGDLAVLAETVPFLTGAPLSDYEDDRYAEYERSETSASLLEHCRRALRKGLTEGVHGLPLMGSGDWNDGMNRIGVEGRGESVWLGFFLCATMARFAELCVRLGEHDEASAWRERATALRSRIESAAWDGEWYVRAFHDDGSIVGAAKNRECRIDSIAQSWAVLSHGEGASAEQNDRERRAMSAADEQLVRESDGLVLLFWPPFDSLMHDPGYIRAYPPGVRENGGQYTHAATWLGWAHARLGDGEKAERVFRLLNPVLHSRTRAQAERYRVEPYALAGDVYGAEPWTGRGGWTLYTGSASWMWRLGVEAILGLQRDRGRLRIDPCIPPAWPGFEAWITLGKTQVHVVVDNPDHVANGIALLTLDGKPLSSNVIELPLNGVATHELRVRLGERPATQQHERISSSS